MEKKDIWMPIIAISVAVIAIVTLITLFSTQTLTGEAFKGISIRTRPSALVPYRDYDYDEAYDYLIDILGDDYGLSPEGICAFFCCHKHYSGFHLISPSVCRCHFLFPCNHSIGGKSIK